MRLRSLILGIHVLCGAGWVAICVGFLVAAAALTMESEAINFVQRVAPRLNRIGLGCACLIPLTGFGNVAFVMQARRGTLPAQFIWILAGKIAFFAVMVLAQVAAVTRLSTTPIFAPGTSAFIELHRLARLYGLIVGAGAGALILGLWLAGV